MPVTFRLFPVGIGGKEEAKKEIMQREVYRYRFDESVALDRAEETLCLASLAAEAVHGRSHVRLDAAFVLDKQARTCVIDAGTDVGETLARIFTGLLAEEFGDEAFRVERVFRTADQNSSKGE